MGRRKVGFVTPPTFSPRTTSSTASTFAEGADSFSVTACHRMMCRLLLDASARVFIAMLSSCHCGLGCSRQRARKPQPTAQLLSHCPDSPWSGKHGRSSAVSWTGQTRGRAKASRGPLEVFLQVSLMRGGQIPPCLRAPSPSGTTHSHTPIHARPAPLMPFSTHTA